MISRRLMKGALEAVAIRSGLPDLLRALVPGRTAVLAYHNVLERGGVSHGDASLHIRVETFVEHLDAIQAHCDVVPLREVFAPEVRGRPRVAITFDDAYRGAVRHALPELARRDLACTVFVPPAYVPDGTFWWDDVASALGGNLGAIRTAALVGCRGREAEVRRRWPSQINAAEHGSDFGCVSMDELRTAVAAAPVSLGSHTWSHPNLTRATPDELMIELSQPLKWLQEHFPGHFGPYISYPYGLQSPTVRDAARRAGYELGFRVSGGWLPSNPGDGLALPRFNVPAGLSSQGLSLRLSSPW